jgi:hypothetical protein
MCDPSAWLSVKWTRSALNGANNRPSLTESEEQPDAMKYQDSYLQSEYERGKSHALHLQEEEPEYQERLFDHFMHCVEERDAYALSAHDPSLDPDRRQAVAALAAYLNGWLSIWDERRRW